MIIKEAQKVLTQQGLDVDKRHLLILSDLMCVGGSIQSIGRHGISGSKSSVFARAAFEVTVNQLLQDCMVKRRNYLEFPKMLS